MRLGTQGGESQTNLTTQAGGSNLRTKAGTTTESISYIVGELLGYPKHNRHGKAYEITKAVLNSIAKALQRGEQVSIAGFGILRVVPCKPRVRCCYYGLTKNGYWEMKDFSGKNRVIFKPSKVLKRLINENIQEEDH